MTEAEWWTVTDPSLMLEYLPAKASDRKLRLLACACCRFVWHSLHDPRSRRAVEVAERYADGTADDDELLAAARAANEANHPIGGPIRYPDFGAHRAAHLTAFAPHTIGAFVNPPAHARPQSHRYAPEAFATADAFVLLACIYVADAMGGVLAGQTGYANWEMGQETEFRRQAGLVRDLLGNPFAPTTFDPIWRTETAVALATGIYDGWAFERLPILADALEEAGCGEEVILTHCREPGDHVRGCWIVDLVLGKG